MGLSKSHCLPSEVNKARHLLEPHNRKEACHQETPVPYFKYTYIFCSVHVCNTAPILLEGIASKGKEDSSPQRWISLPKVTCYMWDCPWRLFGKYNQAVTSVIGVECIDHWTLIWWFLHWLPVGFSIQSKVLVLTFKPFHDLWPWRTASLE